MRAWEGIVPCLDRRGHSVHHRGILVLHFRFRRDRLNYLVIMMRSTGAFGGGDTPSHFRDASTSGPAPTSMAGNELSRALPLYS